MNVFVAGATGTLGRPLVRVLVSAGHTVTGLTRSADKRVMIESAGARAAIADALDDATLTEAVRAASPTHVVHLLTALPPGGALRARDLEATNTVRTTGTRSLLRASIAAGARRVVAESFVAVYGNPDAVSSMGEDGPLPAVPNGPLKDTVLALRDLERQLREAAASGSIETISLRFGGLYGPGVPQTEGLIWQARAGKLMMPRGEPGMMSFVHIDDAVTAIVRALDHGQSGGAYNIVDDRPLPAERYLGEVAQVYGARTPRRVPRWLLRWAAPVAAQLTSWRVPLSNAKARSELGWSPVYPSVADGLRAGRM